MTEEKVIYEQGNIKITNLRAVFGEKTYAMSNITSVEQGTKQPSGCFSFSFLIGGVFLIIFAFRSIEENWGMLALGIIVGIVGIVTLRYQKPEYVVQFGSASGEIKAYTSLNQDEIKQIVQAINEAIIQKG